MAQVLQSQLKPALTLEQAMAEIDRLKAAQSGGGKITLKVGAKGGISVYGLGRFPFSFYRSQAERLFTADFCKTMQDFITANSAALKVKE